MSLNSSRTLPQVVLFGPTACHNEQRLKAQLRTNWQIKTIPEETNLGGLKESLSEADALISLFWNREVAIPNCSLRLVHALGAGMDAFDISALPLECVLCNVYGHEVPIAEYVLGAMVSLTLRFTYHDQELRKGKWDGTGRRDGQPHGELLGRTIGLIGYGHIGREITRRALAFGMNVMAVRARPEVPTDPPRPGWIGGPDQLQYLLRNSDYVVICCALDQRTRHLLNAQTLSWLRPSAYFINVARAEVVQEDALYTVLREKRIAGAALDVWYRYPENGSQILQPSSYPFQELDNVLMTPHYSAWTEAMIERRWKIIAGNLDALALGHPLRCVVFQPSQTHQGSKDSPCQSSSKSRSPYSPRPIVRTT